MQLTFLEPLLARRGPWATVYFDPAQNDASGAKRRELIVRDACRTLEDEGADPATVQAVRDALMNITPQENPGGRVVFAAGGEVALSCRLSRPPQSPIASWAPLPRLTPLLELAGQDPLCLVAYIDRTGADFELRGAAGPKDAGSVEGRQSPIHRTASGDWSQRHFQLKVENTWDHNAGEIAEALGSANEESGAELVVLVGDVRERPAVLERLPEAVSRGDGGHGARRTRRRLFLPRPRRGHRAGPAGARASARGEGTRPIPRRAVGDRQQPAGRGGRGPGTGASRSGEQGRVVAVRRGRVHVQECGRRYVRRPE